MTQYVTPQFGMTPAKPSKDVTSGISPDAGGLRPTPCTCHMIKRTARRLTQYYNEALKPVGLTLAQYSVLAQTDYAASLTVTELAALTDVDRTTLTRNLRPMVEAGWITIGDGSDKRSRAVRLTGRGQTLFRQAHPLWQGAERGFRASLGAEKSQNLRQMLDEAARVVEI
jgi:DNA-binding MarR family transcriptional regulator